MDSKLAEYAEIVVLYRLLCLNNTMTESCNVQQWCNDNILRSILRLTHQSTVNMNIFTTNNQQRIRLPSKNRTIITANTFGGANGLRWYTFQRFRPTHSSDAIASRINPLLHPRLAVQERLLNDASQCSRSRHSWRNRSGMSHQPQRRNRFPR